MANLNLSPSNNLKYTTDFQIESIGIISGSGVFDLTTFLVEMSYFENIFSPCISGNLVLTDAAGMINIMSLNGNEYIKISFRKTNSQGSFGEVINRTFRVVSIKERNINTGNNYETYVIEFCSDEMVLSQQYRLSKSYKKSAISDIITDIMHNYLKIGNGGATKNFYCEQTDGVYDLILPNKKLLDTVSWLSNYAKSSSNKNGADMLFFETGLGFQFSSLQTLFTRPSVQTFTYNPKNIDDGNGNPLLDEEQYEIIKLELLKTFDTLNGTNKGAFSNRLLSINPMLRTYQKTDFNYNNYYAKSEGRLNSSPVVNNMQNRFGKAIYDSPPPNLESGPLRLSVTNSGQDTVQYIKDNPGSVTNNFFVENYIPNRIAQLELAQYNKIKVVIPGYNEVYAGMVISVEIVMTTSVSDAGGQRVLDPYLSGNYLVSALRHLITNTSYITVMELVKDSSLEGHVPVNNGDPQFSQVVKGSQS